MKKYIVISLLLVWATDLLACAIPGTHNYYLFSTIEKNDWQQRVNSLTIENWRTYSGKSEMYWFDADDMKEIAQQKGDGLMISYIDHLQKYLDICTATRETWNYPTKRELLQRKQTLLGIQKYAFSKTKSRLRSQHALLYMRCNMMLGMHQQNITFWEKSASKYINSVYRDMMRNIYAGALLKLHRDDEATRIFIEQGDVSSLYTYYYKKRSFEAIRAEYLHDANSPAFPFLLQDFANNAQEAYDAQRDTDNWPGKLFVRDISLKENRQMSRFCEQVVGEGKTNNPALWQSLRAWLLFLAGDRQQALAASQQAITLEGTPKSKANARILHLFIYASVAPVNAGYDGFLTRELTWLESMQSQHDTENIYDESHYADVFDRLVHQVLFPRYHAASRPETAIAFLSAYDESPFSSESKVRHQQTAWNPNYSSYCFMHLDTITPAQAEQYLAYLKQTHQSPVDEWLDKHILHDENLMYELLGTKYLRIGEWQKAIDYLQKVSLEYINTMNIVLYMACRDYHVEPWMKRQYITNDTQIPVPLHTEHHQKLEYAQEMLSLEQGFGTMAPDEKALRAYQLAILYTQASYAGDCWYLTRYGKSCYDSPRPNELNMLQKASTMLTIAQYTPDFLWREKVYYAQAWLPIDSWYSEEWDEKTYSYIKVPQTNSRQFRALYTLARYEHDHSSQTSDYVSRCDVLKQFRKNL